MTTVTPFTPIKIGSLEIPNRLFMSPMTRSRGVVPSEIVAEYYRQRSYGNGGAGLIVTEGILIEEQGSEYGTVPGLFTEEQIEAWRNVVDTVHNANGNIFAQLWHVGRITHSKLNPNNTQPIGPSAIRALGGNFRTLNGAEYEVPRELSAEEVQQYAKLYGTAAKNARAAGFDGVEIHGANGYLIHQFMNVASNQRSDQYGTQNFENRARFALEVIENVVAGYGDESRVAIRFSPGFVGMGFVLDDQTVPFYNDLLQQIAQRFPNLAYITIGADMSGSNSISVADFRESYKGEGKVLTGTVGFDQARTTDFQEKGIVDAVHIGRQFISNPDLAYRWRHNLPLADVNWATLYSNGATGYTDYPIAEREATD